MNDNGTMNNFLPQTITKRAKPSKGSSYKKCSNKIGLPIALVIILVLTSLLIWLCVLTAKNHSNLTKSLCLTRECIKIATTILERIDQTISPCEDFYQFSCGNFIRSYTVPEDYYARNLLQEMQESMFVEMKNYLEAPMQSSEVNHIQQIKHLYQSCMSDKNDEYMFNNSIDTLFDLIIELTGNEWPVLTTNLVTAYQVMSFERQLALLFLHQVQTFFQIFVAPHKNSSSYALHIFPGSTVMEQQNFGISKHLDNLSENQINFYKDFQKETVQTLLVFKSNAGAAKDSVLIEKELNEMIRFELDLVNITKDISSENVNCTFASNSTTPFESQLCDDPLTNLNLFLNISLEQMDREFPYINWTNYFQIVLQEANVTVTHVLIHSKEYFRSLIEIFKNNSKRTVMNYLGWSVVTKYMPYLGQHFKHISSEFQQKILMGDTDVTEIHNGFKYYTSRWKQCVYIACESMKIPSITLYMREHSQNLTKTTEQISNLIEEMKKSFLTVIDAQTWIVSDDIKELLKERVSGISSNIGVPLYIRNQTLVEKMYAQLSINSSKELISNIFKINKHETILDVKKLGTKANAGGEWLFQPLDANAFYDFTLNDIIIPIGIMRKPLVNTRIPKYLELSFLGIVIGHEIAHSIDINSRKHISEKNDNLLTGDFGQIYKRKAQCFSEKYSSYVVDEANQSVNGNQTLEENICDFASFQTAFSIYRNHNVENNLELPGLSQFSTDQLFFIQYAQLWCEVATKDGHVKNLQDNHSPGRYRANGVIMNSRTFSDTFDCLPNSKMNPQDKCDLWAAGF